MTFLKSHPFLSFALVGILLLALSAILGARHDSGGALGGLYIAAAFFCLPFWFVLLLLKPLLPGPPGSLAAAASVAVGLSLCALADKLLEMRRKPKRGNGPGEGVEEGPGEGAGNEAD